MKNLVIGYYDLNFGDDWLIHKFIAEYNLDDVILLMNDPHLFVPYRENNIITYSGKYGKVKSFLSSREIDIVGGSMFQQGENWLKHYCKMYLIISFAKILRKKVNIVGCNINESKNELLTFILQRIFRKVDHIRVRDRKSHDIFIDFFNLNKQKVQLSRDLADQKILLKKPQDNSCAVSIINNSGINREEYFTWLISNIRKLHLENGVKDFIFYAFDSGNESDEKAISLFLAFARKELTDLDIKCEIYNGEVDIFIQKWQESKYALCTRFHSYILARNSQQEFLIYNYSHKIKEYITTHHPHELSFLNAG